MSLYAQRVVKETTEYGERLYCGMVAERDTLQEVQDYCMRYSGEQRVIALTIFHMTLNTVANNLEKIVTPTEEENTL